VKRDLPVGHLVQSGRRHGDPEWYFLASGFFGRGRKRAPWLLDTSGSIYLAWAGKAPNVIDVIGASTRLVFPVFVWLYQWTVDGKTLWRAEFWKVPAEEGEAAENALPAFKTRVEAESPERAMRRYMVEAFQPTQAAATLVRLHPLFLTISPKVQEWQLLNHRDEVLSDWIKSGRGLALPAHARV